jgi:hypothetical protein
MNQRAKGTIIIISSSSSVCELRADAHRIGATRAAARSVACSITQSVARQFVGSLDGRRFDADCSHLPREPLRLGSLASFGRGGSKVCRSPAVCTTPITIPCAAPAAPAPVPAPAAGLSGAGTPAAAAAAGLMGTADVCRECPALPAAPDGTVCVRTVARCPPPPGRAVNSGAGDTA